MLQLHYFSAIKKSLSIETRDLISWNKTKLNRQAYSFNRITKTLNISSKWDQNKNNLSIIWSSTSLASITSICVSWTLIMIIAETGGHMIRRWYAVTITHILYGPFCTIHNVVCHNTHSIWAFLYYSQCGLSQHTFYMDLFVLFTMWPVITHILHGPFCTIHNVVCHNTYFTWTFLYYSQCGLS